MNALMSLLKTDAFQILLCLLLIFSTLMAAAVYCANGRTLWLKLAFVADIVFTVLAVLAITFGRG